MNMTVQLYRKGMRSKTGKIENNIYLILTEGASTFLIH